VAAGPSSPRSAAAARTDWPARADGRDSVTGGEEAGRQAACLSPRLIPRRDQRRQPRRIGGPFIKPAPEPPQP
jgi:hypothetical protein